MINHPLLEITSLCAAYGAVQVLFNVDMVVDRGEIICIIGPNGAGKSTVIKSVIGLVEIRSGTLSFQGDDITGLETHRAPLIGIGYVPQGRIVFSHLSVKENLEMGAYLQKNKAKRDQVIEEVFEQFPRLKERYKQPAGKLSGGEQQMLAIGRALMMHPKLIILDEPSLGLSPKYVDLIYEKLLNLKFRGLTILMVEQNAARGLDLSDRGYALELGRNRYSGLSSELLVDEDVRRMYLGGA